MQFLNKLFLLTITKHLALFLLLITLSIELAFADRNDLCRKEREIVNKVTVPTLNFDKAEKFEAMTGGAGTISDISRNSFSHHLSTLTFKDKQNFLIGNGMFRKVWVSSPSSTKASDGLGPLFNSRSCQSCHIKDGRGNLPSNKKPLSLVVKTGKYKGLNLIPDDVYGKQFQSFGVAGVSKEVDFSILRRIRTLSFSNNTQSKVSDILISPIKFYYGKIDYANSISPRISPQVIGMGLLEAIRDEDIIKKHDPYDKNKDGISGRVHWLKSREEGNNKKLVGRFGLRAATHSLTVQSSVAFMHDMGISNPLSTNRYGDCTKHQVECLNAPHGVQPNLGKNETNMKVLDSIVFYLSSLSPPKRRNVTNKSVLKGKEIFYNSGCISCHTPKYVTSKSVKKDFLKYQLIWPYSDLLLHDMGDELADKDLNGNITNKEWRTPPLWGIGLAQTVNPNATFLHDGRAKNILEAILWHSGEAQSSIDFLHEKYSENIKYLVSFLESL